MLARPEQLAVILAMAAIVFMLRASGFWLMRFVRLSPRIEAGLKVLPLAIMVGIVAPAAARGGVPEIAGIAGIIGVRRLTGSDVAGILAGLGIVALLRHLLAA